MGISVVNALSTRVITEVHRQGYAWHISFSNGGVPDGPLRKGEPSDKTGTIQTFYPDPEIFETVEFDFETLRVVRLFRVATRTLRLFCRCAVRS